MMYRLFVFEELSGFTCVLRGDFVGLVQIHGQHQGQQIADGAQSHMSVNGRPGMVVCDAPWSM